MKQYDKLKVLIDSIKTANDLMRKQIEINGRAVELLGEFITEPESIELNQSINWWSTLTNKQQWDYRFEIIGHRGGVLTESEIEEIWRKKTKEIEPTTIKPEDMKAGEWYVVEVIGTLHWLIKFRVIEQEKIYTDNSYHISRNKQYHGVYWRGYPFCNIKNVLSIRKATQEEILKYFPNELEVDTHGGNDAGHIQEVTDTQIK